jgi:PAS domain S-box-containing protein
MTTVLLVTPDDALRARLQRAFPDSSVFMAASDADALRTLQLVEADAVFRDSRGTAQDLGTFLSRARELAGTAVVIAVGPPEEATDAADLVLPAAFTQRDLDAVLRQLAEKRRLLSEIESLRAKATPPAAERQAEGFIESPAQARVLKEFTRVFAAGFDLPRTLEMFLEALGELLRPARVALLLQDEGRQAYRVVAHRGLAPQIVQAVRLSSGQGLCRWLAAQGRPARLQDLADHPELLAELKLLAGVVAVPMLTHGELVGILVVGPPVVGSMYARPETEVLFDLATHLATAIRDIGLHHQIEREKQFNERILAHMSSGVVTIGRDEKIGTMNRRAEEILGLEASEALHRDLRVLPSPLGDMLFETLAYARALPPTEIHLGLRRLWLEVSTYPVRSDEGPPLGAVLVFEDRTAQKELAVQKRQAEEFQLLARVIARIADEIKNPLVSINTFVELIDERYDDPDFRKLFATVVRRDVRRLVQVFEKLAGLVSEGELNFSTVDVHAVVDEAVASIEVGDDALGKHLQIDFTRDSRPQLVKVDQNQFRRALAYLVWYLTHNSPGEEAHVSVSVGRHTEREEGESVRVLVTSRTAAVPPERLERLFDPVRMAQESLIDVGPAVSQRLVEAQGGRLQVRRGRHELAFQVSLPPASE